MNLHAPVNVFTVRSPSPSQPKRLPHFRGTDETVAADTSPRKGWSLPWYRKILRHRFKIALIPLLVAGLPSCTPSTTPSNAPASFSSTMKAKAEPSPQASESPEGLRLPTQREATLILMLLLLAPNLLAELVMTKKRVAYHELAHMLIAHHQGIQVAQVSVFGFLGGATQFNPKNMGRPEQMPSESLCLAAGEAMEELIFGYARLNGLACDKERSYEILLNSLFGFKGPEWKNLTTQNLLFPRQSTEKAKAILKTLDRSAVDQAAKLLRKEKEWDLARIQEICRMFNFPLPVSG